MNFILFQIRVQFIKFELHNMMTDTALR